MYFIIISIYIHSFSRFSKSSLFFSQFFRFFVLLHETVRWIVLCPSSEIRLLCGTVLLEQNTFMCEFSSNVCFLECYINSKILQILYARVTENVFKQEKKRNSFPCAYISRWIIFIETSKWWNALWLKKNRFQESCCEYHLQSKYRPNIYEKAWVNKWEDFMIQLEYKRRIWLHIWPKSILSHVIFQGLIK